MKRIVSYVVILFLALSFTLSCSKEGPTGPAGAQGPQGSAGAAGPAGPTGPAGTANVIYSNWEYAEGSGTRDTTIDASKLLVENISADSVTSANLTTSTILVYFTFGSGDFPLPYTSYAGGLGSTISFIPEPGTILITRFAFDNSASIGISTACQFRYIVIPGGVNVPDKSDYEGTMRYLHIPLN